MNLRKIFPILVIFGLWTSVSGQNANLLKNPGGEEGSEYWRAFKEATVEQCSTGQCFVLRGGYFIQDVAVPKDAVGQYALLIGRAYSETPTALPSLYGYMMNSGDPSGGRIYAYLSGQQMMGPSESSSDWTQLWGIFKVKPGTGRISFFLKQAMNGGGNAGAVRFDDLGLYIFSTEAQARAVVGPLAANSKSTGYAGAGSECRLSRESLTSLYGIRLGMSPEEVVSLFPANARNATVDRALELSQSRNPVTQIVMMINADRVNNPDQVDVKEFFFRFRNKGLYSLHVDYLSPQWKDVNEFIDQRGHILNLSAASSWEPVEGNARSSKYLICDGIEVRFYAAPRGSSNNNYISLTDTTVETTPEAARGRPASQP